MKTSRLTLTTADERARENGDLSLTSPVGYRGEAASSEKACVSAVNPVSPLAVCEPVCESSAEAATPFSELTATAPAGATTEAGATEALPDATIDQPASRGALCALCGRVHPGGRNIRGCPGSALKHGRASILLGQGRLPSQAEALAAIADRQHEIEQDLGGGENLSRIHRDTVRDLLRLELIGDFLFERLLAGGVMTGKGRTRAATVTYLQVIDRVNRLRQMVGLARVPRHVDPLEAIRRAVKAANDNGEGPLP
jgi:hypothetical protein